jgi:hypothetical protein
LAILPLIVPSSMNVTRRRGAAGDASAWRLVVASQLAQQLGHDPVGDRLGIGVARTAVS